MQKLLQVMMASTFLIAVRSIAVAASPEGQPPPLPAPRLIPGVTAPDQFPRGCVDCHVNRLDVEKDVRLSTFMQEWQVQVAPLFLAKVRTFSPAEMPLKGKHPKIGGGLADIPIPSTCLKCHSRTSKTAPPFARLLHGLHLVGGEKNHFVTMFQGECTHCHKLDTATGRWSLGGGTEAK